jgi:hypothetical protein
MIWGCQCPVPKVHTVHANKCERCGRFLDPRIIDTDENLAEFRQQLEAIPDFPKEALDHAYRREVAGRKEFGLEYLNRNNPVEGMEEAADGCNYSFYHWLRRRREGVEEIDPNLLEAARHFALAYRALLRAEQDDVRP